MAALARERQVEAERLAGAPRRAGPSRRTAAACARACRASGTLHQRLRSACRLLCPPQPRCWSSVKSSRSGSSRWTRFPLGTCLDTSRCGVGRGGHGWARGGGQARRAGAHRPRPTAAVCSGACAPILHCLCHPAPQECQAEIGRLSRRLSELREEVGAGFRVWGGWPWPQPALYNLPSGSVRLPSGHPPHAPPSAHPCPLAHAPHRWTGPGWRWKRCGRKAPPGSACCTPSSPRRVRGRPGVGPERRSGRRSSADTRRLPLPAAALLLLRMHQAREEADAAIQRHHQAREALRGRCERCLVPAPPRRLQGHPTVPWPPPCPSTCPAPRAAPRRSVPLPSPQAAQEAIEPTRLAQRKVEDAERLMQVGGWGAATRAQMQGGHTRGRCSFWWSLHAISAQAQGPGGATPPPHPATRPAAGGG